MTPLFLAIAALFLLAIGGFIGAEWRKDYNRSLYTDEQHKRNTAEDSLRTLQTELTFTQGRLDQAQRMLVQQARDVGDLRVETESLKKRLLLAGETVPGLPPRRRVN